MNVYDFDKTIFYPDSTIKFTGWCIRRHPGLLFRYVPKLLRAALQYRKGKIPYYKFVLASFSFLKYIDHLDEEIECFWDANEKNISQWYLAQKKPDDLIISASPECIIQPIAKRLGVNCVATQYDMDTGVLCGNLMLARSKSRFVIDMGFPVIDNFYSDSLSDTPLALCAEHAFLVTEKAKKPVPWPKMDRETLEKTKKKIDTGWKQIGND